MDGREKKVHCTYAPANQNIMPSVLGNTHRRAPARNTAAHASPGTLRLASRAAGALALSSGPAQKHGDVSMWYCMSMNRAQMFTLHQGCLCGSWDF